MQTMKRTISLLLVLVSLFCLILTGCGSEAQGTPAKKLTDEEYHTLMTPLYTTMPSGDRIVTFLDNQYSRKYIPETLQAQAPEEVGYILRLEVDRISANYTRGLVWGEKIQAYLIDSSTGMTIAETHFKTVFPETLMSDVWNVPVPEEDIMTWVEHRYPGTDDSIHTWVPADCTNAETCSLCGRTRQDALGHNWIPGDCNTQRICSRCSIPHREIPDHQVDTWEFAENTTSKMHGLCSVCNKDIRAETDWELFHSLLICDRWPLKYVETKEIRWRETEEEVWMEVRENGTAAITYQDQQLDFTWTFDPVSTATSEHGWVYYTFTRNDTGESVRVQCLPKELDIHVNEYDLDFVREYPSFS